MPQALSGQVRGRLTRALAELAVTIERTTTIVAQARTRLAGQTPSGAARLVSLHDALDVRTIAIPRKAKHLPPAKPSSTGVASAVTSSGAPDRKGASATSSRSYGWDRTHLDGIKGTQIWCGHRVFAHNLVKIAALAS